MNDFEQKLLLLCKTPESRWFDLRMKPIFSLLQEMERKGSISVNQLDVPVYTMMGIRILYFKYDKKWYFVFVQTHQTPAGLVNDFFQVESYYSKPGFSSITQTDIVATSDDDNWGPNKKTNNRYLMPLMMAKDFMEQFTL
jgi:hypothetical protein